MSRRADPLGTIAMLALAALVAGAALFAVFAGVPVETGVGGPVATATASPTARPTPPEVTIAHDANVAQAARFLRAWWTSTVPVISATVALAPDPGFECAATVDPAGLKGVFGCVGLLRGATDYTATLGVRTASGIFPFAHAFRTMGDRLQGVQWFTEFEDPRGEPLACAAASCRIVQNYTTGQDPLTAAGILALGQQFNRSRDPGLDPAAIASVLTRMDARNRYHYYVLPTREEATKSAIYWLLRSGKPVIVITLAGQHAPVLIGYSGAFGTHYGDPTYELSGVVMQDPQRGDMRPETAFRRPDKYRSPDFQTGRLLGLDEWFRDEWWLGFAYWYADKGVPMDRSDGAYPLPHWSGKFVIVVDDGDAENPSDRMGRVAFR